MAQTTCHSRYCPVYFNGFFAEDKKAEACKNIALTFEIISKNSATSEAFIRYNQWIKACCRLFCGEQSQLLQLQCQNTSERMAILIWFMVVVLVLCAFIQLVSVSLEWGARKVAMVGGPLLLAFISLIVYLVTDENFIPIDTPFYPIVGAMNVAAFSYFFSSFQYSISFAHELASSTALIFTMFPIWTLLTVKVKILIRMESGDPDTIRKMVASVIVMLLLSVLWTIHSSLYRTVGYRAAWITALNKQRDEGHAILQGKNFMCRLWVLAGAQGHPTWRTPAGQSIGLYLAVLSWVISVTTHNTLKKSCHEDLILFHILLWVPSMFLTTGVLSTQTTMCNRASCDGQENGNFLWQWFMAEFQYLWETYKNMEEAVISYRLGRDTLEVESNIKKYKLILCGGKIQRIDKFIGVLVFFIEVAIFGITYPGILFLKVIRWLGICILKCMLRRNVATPSYANLEQVPSRLSRLCPTFEWFPRRQRNEFSLNEMIQAFRILCENCLTEEISEYYVSSSTSARQGDHGLTNDMIHEEVCKIFRRHGKNIRLSLLLDNIGPSRFIYLLEKLVFVINEERNEMNPLGPRRSM